MTNDERILTKGKIPLGGRIHGDGDRVAQGAIAFGVGVEAGTDKSTQVKTYAGGIFAGIAAYDARRSAVLDGSGGITVLRNYQDGDAVFVLTVGPCVVEVKETVARDDPVYCDSTTGDFWKSAGAGRVLVPGGKFKSASSTVGGVKFAEVGINLA